MTKKEKTLYLIDMIDRFPDKRESPLKWNRWLGFVQGAMWAMGLKSIEEMKAENRDDLDSALANARKSLQASIPGSKNNPETAAQ